MKVKIKEKKLSGRTFRMNIEKIWFAVVGVKSLKGNEIISDAKGAHVNVACISGNEENFKKILQKNFLHHKLKVFETFDIETEDNLVIDNPDDAEKIRLLNEIKEGYKFAWGTFYTF